MPDPSPNAAGAPLLEVKDLRIAFAQDRGEPAEVVSGISFAIPRGESLAVVGESGSGKSVSALALTRLLPEPAAQLRGAIRFGGKDVLAMGKAELRELRGRGIAYVFQEPSVSLNPVFTIRSQIAECLRQHQPGIEDRDAEIARLLAEVGIAEPERRMGSYPHQLSGGQQQRAMIAMALACRPELLVADEPTTALDVTIQAQIIELLAELKRSRGMSILLITHNFGIIQGIADRVAVMFRGKIVEQGPTAEVLGNPQHAYTKALINCVPRLGEKRRRLETIDYAAVEA
ncbi:MAG: ABC transporter ATP-binding protein [Verrucomicrobiales bacterium]